MSLQRGEARYNAVLNETIVRRCREAVEQGNTTVYRLAKDLGINQRTLRDAVNFVTWKHVR